VIKETDPILPGEQTTIDFFASNPPAKPEIITGEKRLKVGGTYTFSTSTVDPDGDKIFYQWSWGDGTFSEWLGPYSSGEICEASHSWDESYLGIIEVLVKDEDGNVNIDRAYLTIHVRENKAMLNILTLNKLLNKINLPLFSILAKLLQKSPN
jgi:hypothetical protein